MWCALREEGGGVVLSRALEERVDGAPEELGFALQAEASPALVEFRDGIGRDADGGGPCARRITIGTGFIKHPAVLDNLKYEQTASEDVESRNQDRPKQPKPRRADDRG